MVIVSNEKMNFNSLEEKIYKKMMELGRNLIKDELKLIDKLIKQYRDKGVFKIKDSQKTTIKTRLGEIEFFRRRYEMEINGTKKYIYLLDELLEINSIGQYSQSIVEMIIREIVKKSYRETAKTITEDTNSVIRHTAVRNIVIACRDYKVESDLARRSSGYEDNTAADIAHAVSRGGRAEANERIFRV